MTASKLKPRPSAKPITPDDLVKAKEEYFPDKVFEAFNLLIAKYYNGGSAVIKQSEIVSLIGNMLKITNKEVLERKYLDIEEVYRAAGWYVNYDRPGFNEQYEPMFTFRKYNQ